MRIIALFVALFCGSAHAQLTPMTGAGYTGPVVAGGYSGPGDVVPGALAWWGFRCYSNAYSGLVADITDSATGNTTGTRLQCSSGTVSALVSASACTFVTGNACSALATTCAVACNLLTFYDQSGSTNCGAAACNVTNSTNPNRPTVTVSCQNSMPCAVFNGSSQELVNTSAVTSQAQPINMSFVAERTGNFTSYQGVAVYGTGGSPYGGFNNAANQVVCYAGSVGAASATDSALHAVQIQFNGASSSFYVDGSSTGSQNCGTTGGSGTYMTVGQSGFGQLLTGQFYEAGFWAGNFSGGNQSAMNTNQHSSSNGWNF